MYTPPPISTPLAHIGISNTYRCAMRYSKAKYRGGKIDKFADKSRAERYAFFAAYTLYMQ